MLDEPISSENGPSTPKNLMVEEVQIDGAPTEKDELWKVPKIVESTLKKHGFHLQKNIQRQQQKRRPSTIKRCNP